MNAAVVIEVVCRAVAGAAATIDPDRSVPNRCMSGVNLRRWRGLRLRLPCWRIEHVDVQLRPLDRELLTGDRGHQSGETRLRRHRRQFSARCAHVGRLVEDYDPTTGTFLTRDPHPEGEPAGTTVHANPYAYVRNDPLNLTDPLGLRADECKFGDDPDGCDEIVKILKRLLPRWKAWPASIHTKGCGLGASTAGRLCVSKSELQTEWDNNSKTGELYRRMANNQFQDAWEFNVIHEYGHVINNAEIFISSGTNDKGWPSVNDLDRWAWDLYHIDSTGAFSDTWKRYDAQAAILAGMNKLKSEKPTLLPVDELMADCIGQSAKPNVKGGYWLLYEPQSSTGCTAEGVTLARKLVNGENRYGTTR